MTKALFRHPPHLFHPQTRITLIWGSSLEFEPDCGILEKKELVPDSVGFHSRIRIPSELLLDLLDESNFMHVSNADRLDVARCKTSTSAGLLAHSLALVM